MEMQGQRELAATQQQAWEALNDPTMLQACIPGCERFEADGEHAYRVVVALRIGPVAAKFTGRVQLSDIQPPTSYRLEFDAQGGVAGFGKGQSAVTLTPKGQGCELSYTVQSTVGGKIAQLGQRLIDGVAKTLAEDFFKRFDTELQRRHAEAQTQADQMVGETAPMGGEPAAGPFRLSDLPPWVWAPVGAAVVVVLWWIQH